MPGLARHACLVLALASSACTITNPAFGLTADSAGGSGDSGGDSSTGAPGTTTTEPVTGTDPTVAPTTGVGTTTTTTTVGTSSSSTTLDPGTTAMASTGAPDPLCGDGKTDPGEACDDGNNIDGDGCQANCAYPGCGDGVVDGNEECDDGNDVDEDDCLSTCVAAQCGDDVVHMGVEECDDGNDVDGDGCSSLCAIELCGNGNIDPGEECDDGNDVNTDMCTNMCKSAKCGDGIVSLNEQCDDGNGVDNDMCKNNCTLGPCGDKFWDVGGGEQCDPSAAPFTGYPELCGEACKLNTCAKIVNTGDNDIQDLGWFDACAGAVGDTVHLVVVSLADKSILYKGSGQKTMMWTKDHLTSTAIPEQQYLIMKHLPILFANGDRLYLFGKYGAPVFNACPSSLGDGYGAAVYPPLGDTPKLLVMSTNGTTLGKRNFTGWSAFHEISYNQGVAMPLCMMGGPTASSNTVAFFLVK